MSDFADFIAEGFEEAAEIFGTDTLTCGDAEAPCVATVPQMTQQLRESGLWEKIAQTVTLSRADFTALAIEDRSDVQLGGRDYKVMLIEDDGSAAIVTLQLQRLN